MAADHQYASVIPLGFLRRKDPLSLEDSWQRIINTDPLSLEDSWQRIINTDPLSLEDS